MINRKLMGKRLGFSALVTLFSVVVVQAFIYVAFLVGFTFIGLYIHRELRKHVRSPATLRLMGHKLEFR